MRLFRGISTNFLGSPLANRRSKDYVWTSRWLSRFLLHHRWFVETSEGLVISKRELSEIALLEAAKSAEAEREEAPEESNCLMGRDRRR